MGEHGQIPSLGEALVLSEPSPARLSLQGAALKHFERFVRDCGVARASLDAIVACDGLERLRHDEWVSLISWCREVLRPDGVLVLGLGSGSSMAPGGLKKALARCFGSVELFGWDGARRTPAHSGSAISGHADSATSAHAGYASPFAICRPFLPYAVRSLELLRPRVLSDGPGWQSSWLCERPALPDRFLLRGAVDVLGEIPGGVDLRLKLIGPAGDRFRLDAHLSGSETACATADLLLASERAAARGSPSWAEVERIALEIRSDAPGPVDVRLSDVRVLYDAGHSPRSRPVTRTSADLREGYDESYYRAMSGYPVYREQRELRELVNVHRAYALMLSPAPGRVLDIGCGRGELAEHLIDRGAEVTLLDYSPTAIEFAKRLLGERPRARFVVDDAANLAAHVPEQSQDAIFMTDFVEHLSVDELRPVLTACRRVLAPGGVLIIHTPERYSGSIATAKAIHGLHVNLFEIDTLRALLAETFGAVEAFTWDGFERFQRRGHCIELFACARAQDPSPIVHHLPAKLPREGANTEQTWRSEWVYDCPHLPARFLLDATVNIARPNDSEGSLGIDFLTADGTLVAQAERELSRIQTFPAHLRLASELLAPHAPPPWEEVERIVISATSPPGSKPEIAVSDACLRTPRELYPRRRVASERGPIPLLERKTAAAPPASIPSKGR
jgi:SAM-dependent methyltransferase